MTAERRQCPDEYQEAINERFGVNRFGGPLYKIAWGQTETVTQLGRRGYEERLLCGNVACWNILRWREPETFGTPRLYNMVNRDEVTGLCFLGPYPYEGRFDNLQPLMDRDFKNGQLVIDAFPLCYRIIDLMIPLFERAKQLSEIEVAAANAYAEALENKEQVDRITDQLMEEMPTRFGPVSYGRGGCKTAVITKKMQEISKVWSRMDKSALKRAKPGFYQDQFN